MKKNSISIFFMVTVLAGTLACFSTQENSTANQNLKNTVRNQTGNNAVQNQNSINSNKDVTSKPTNAVTSEKQNSNVTSSTATVPEPKSDTSETRKPTEKGKINPNGATARCRDGSLSYSQSRRGTCSHHGGVADWY